MRTGERTRRAALRSLANMEKAAGLIIRKTAGLGEQAFMDDDDLCDATAMRLIGLGEEAKKVRQFAPEIVAANPQVDWGDVAKMRDKLSHYYFEIDYSIVYDVAVNRLPELLAQLRTVKLPPWSDDKYVVDK